jgi:hypothetical protein
VYRRKLSGAIRLVDAKRSQRADVLDRELVHIYCGKRRSA